MSLASALEIRSITNPLSGRPECDEFNLQAQRINQPLETSTIDAGARFALTPSSSPAYELSLLTTPSPTNPSGELRAAAEVVDRSTGEVLARASRGDFFRPAWYDKAGQGRRFAIGGARDPLSAPHILDSFEGYTAIVPPDPMQPGAPNGAAPVLETSTATTVKDSTSFLYLPADPSERTLQTDFDDPDAFIDPNKIELKRAAVIRGVVLDEQGLPLPGASVTVLEDREFGRTHTRADGAFDMAVNGGGPLTVVYEKEGYLTAHRKIDVPWQDFVTAPEVVLVEKDPIVKSIDLDALAMGTEMAVARGSAIADDDQDGPAGPRQATLLFVPGTSATMELPGGTQVPLGQISVRATEYTIEPNGLEKMPAELPPTTAYTYAVELSIDEADAAGARRVTFSEPVIFYLENFLDFPFDQPEAVPVGYYDRETATWVASESGKFVRITGVTGGSSPLAEVDTDGDGVADNQGISTVERETLAKPDLYGEPPFPKILWRVPIPHFSPWDCNWPEGPPPGAGPCGCDPPSNAGGSPPGCQDTSSGSVISCQTQTLGESLPITGTPFRLHYQSERVLGRAAGRTLRLSLKGDNPPSAENLLRIEIGISVAGQQFTDSIPIDPELPEIPEELYQFTWDGKDVYGRLVQGRVPASVRIGYVYRTQYGRVAAFGEYPQSIVTGTRGRREATFWQFSEVWLESWDARGWGLGAWTFDVHHTYDPANRVLLLGEGSRRSADLTTTIVDTFAGGGTNVAVPDGTPATEAKLVSPGGLAVDADGSVYIGEQNRVRRVAPDGTIHLLAGAFSAAGFNGEGPDLATNLRISSPAALAIAPDGSVYFADPGHSRIRRIYKEGTATMMVTFAGSSPCGAGGCTFGYGGDGGAATAALLNRPAGVAVGPDGSVYIADTFNHIIRRVGTDGTIETIAGTPGTPGTSGDGGPAIDALLRGPTSVAVDSEGVVYVAIQGSFFDGRIRRIGTDGIITTVAGLPAQPGVNPPDGSVAAETGLFNPLTVSVGPDSSLYIADRNDWGAGERLIRRVTASGYITTVAGNGLTDGTGDGGPARSAAFNAIKQTAVGPDGSLYLADQGNGKIRRLNVILPDPPTSATEILIPSSDGSEVYVFDHSGQHQRTRDALTGADIYAFDYDEFGRLTKITDRSGNETTIAHAPFTGYPSTGSGTITAPGGQQTAFVLDPSLPEIGYLKSLSNPASETTQLEYSNEGLLTRLIDPRGSAWEFTYDTGGLGLLVKDADPEVLDQDPNGFFKMLSRVDESARMYAVTLTTALGRTFDYVVESLASGQTRRVRTDPSGNESQTIIGIDDSHEVTLPDGTLVSSSMTPEIGRFGMAAPLWTDRRISTPAMRAANPPKAAVITQSRVVTGADAGDPFSLTGLQHVLSINGRQFERNYDAATRLITDTTAEGRQRLTTLDANGRVVMVRVDGLHEISFEYDVPRGRLHKILQGIENVNERVYTLRYDPIVPTRLASIENPAAGVVSFNYNLADRVMTQTLPDSEQIGFGYDAGGNLTSLTPPGKPAHEFQHTKVSLEKNYLPPDPTPALFDADTHYIYNADRQLDLVMRPRTQATDPDASIQIDYQYEAGTDRLSKIVLPAGQGEISYAYDQPSGQLRTVIGPDPVAVQQPRTLTYSYDGFLPTSTTWGCAGAAPCPPGTVEGAVSREYDSSFRVVKQHVNGANEVIYGYDDDDLLEVVTVGTATFEITRDAPQGAGLISATTLTNGSPTPKVTDSRTYNDFGEIVAYEARYNDSTLLYSVTYVRDDLGRITQKDETIADGSGGTDSYNWVYTYDSMGRLDTVTKNSVLVADYSYDPNGNRIAGPGLTMPPTYDDQDRLLEYGSTTYTYAPNGELASKTVGGASTTTYEYDAAGNLRRITFPNDAVLEYVVDGLNQRIGKKVGTTTQAATLVQGVLYDGQRRVAAELNSNNEVISRFVYLSDSGVPEVMFSGSSVYRIVADHLGTVRLVVNLQGGEIMQRIDYDEFGIVLTDTSPGFQPFGFAGGLMDTTPGPNGDSRLLRFGFRDYAAEVGRWTTKDPILFKGEDSNLYGYVLSDPVNRIDPDGRSSLVVTAPIGLGGIGIGGFIGAGALLGGGLIGILVDPFSEIAPDPPIPPYSPADPLAPPIPHPYGPLTPECREVAAGCRAECIGELGGDRCSQGFPFFNCVNACMRRNGC